MANLITTVAEYEKQLKERKGEEKKNLKQTMIES